MIDFEPIAHEYRKDGIQYDSVTQVCSRVLGTENPWWKPEHRLRGNFVHRITEAIDDHVWDPRLTKFPDSLGWDDAAKDKIIQRGFAYSKFLESTGFRATEKELVVWSDSLRMAGKLDKLGIFTLGRHAGEEAILDIKSGEPTPAAIIQIQLYEILLEESFPRLKGRIKHRVILHLREDGDCRPEYRNGSNAYHDRVDALSVAHTYHFMKRHKLT